MKSFLDTNIFVYQLDSRDARKQTIANALVRKSIADGNACISYQVVQECLNVITRNAAVALDSRAAQRYLDVVLAPLMGVPASANLFHDGLALQARYRFSFYDAMIVSAALSAGCTRLYSEDLQHGQAIGALTVVNPFL